MPARNRMKSRAGTNRRGFSLSIAHPSDRERRLKSTLLGDLIMKLSQFFRLSKSFVASAS
ncbi:hypothetical protein NXC14_CH03879 [Rhizobium sp. NXC14]|nr:hypothetical protein NXC14_CH03879 [Rhizobium sp. NXC14]